MRTPRLHYRFPGVGLIRVSAGTSDPAIVADLASMLRRLYGVGRLDLLEAIRDRKVKPLEVFSNYRKLDPEWLPTPEGMLPLAGALDWAKRRKSAETRQGYRSLLTRFLAACPPDAQLGQAPGLLGAYRDAAAPVAFNRLRMALRGYVSAVTPRNHPLRWQLAAVEPNRERPRHATPFPVRELALLAQRMGKHGPMVWTLALTGMRRAEYWGPWVVREPAVLVPGVKKRQETRVVPYVGLAEKPGVQYRAFLTALKAAAPGRILHDLRATAAHLWEEARVPRTRRKQYLGHSAADVTDGYERHEVEAYLREDAGRVRDYLRVELVEAGLVTTNAPLALTNGEG